MRGSDFTSAHWRKSTHSNAETACVEVATTSDEVGIRDSKLGHASPVVTVNREGWNVLLVHLKIG